MQAQTEPLTICDKEHYEFLAKCASTASPSKWNDWRKNKREVQLDGANLAGLNLRGFDLSKCRLRKAQFQNTQLERVDFSGALLEDANFYEADLTGAQFSGAELKNAYFFKSNVSDADFIGAKLTNASFTLATLDRSKFVGAILTGAVGSKSSFKFVTFGTANLQGTRFEDSHFNGTSFYRTNLHAATLTGSHFQEADLTETDLTGADLRFAIIDGATLLHHCKIDLNTDCRGVGLDNARIDVSIKEVLKHNIRRKEWQQWYLQHSILKWPVSLFWNVSAYGSSTGRILFIATLTALFFSLLYLFLPDLTINLHSIQGTQLPLGIVIVRAIYFSVVTMSTLGFGDVSANPFSFWGHIVVTLQVLSGYLLFGTIITRLGILFVGGGPFEKKSKVEDNDTNANAA